MTTGEWAKKKCVPCEGGAQALDRGHVESFLSDLPGWSLAENGKSITRAYVMKSFLAAVTFIQKIAQVAEAEDHHPDLHLTGYRNLRIEMSTHAIGGLSENDFILAAKIDQLPKDLSKK